MSDLDLDALEATARAATPGPWVAGDPKPDRPNPVIRLYGSGWTPIWIEDYSARHVRPSADAYYIVAAQPSTTLALIARIQEAEKLLAEAEATIEAVEALLPKWAETRAYNAEAFTTGGIGMMREIDYAGDLRGILTRHQDKRENGSVER